MKSLSAGLLAHYASGATTLATLWKITRRDGEVFAFTDHDTAITYPPAGITSLTYEPTSVYDASAVSTKSELNVDGLDVKGLLDSAGITVDDMEAGLWDGADIEIVEVNHRDLSMGENVLRVGTLGEVQREGQTYTIELRGLMHRYQNTVGRIVTPACDAVLGDSRCGVDLDALISFGIVTGATDARTFTASGLALAAGYFSYGVVEWLSGNNAGRSMEVKQHEALGVFTLQLPMSEDIQVGDTFNVTPGCDKTKATCIAKFSNVVNFRGFSFVPGQDQVLKVGGQ